MADSPLIRTTQGDGSVVLTRRSIYNTREPSPRVLKLPKKKSTSKEVLFFLGLCPQGHNIGC